MNDVDLVSFAHLLSVSVADFEQINTSRGYPSFSLTFGLNLVCNISDNNMELTRKQQRENTLLF